MYCECGCGEKTPTAKKTNQLRQHIKGQPIRFVPGHQGRKKLKQRKKLGFIKDAGRWYVVCRSKFGKELWSRIVYQNFYLNGDTIPSRMFVHYRDENTDNDDPSNLELISIENHSTLHRGKVTVIEQFNIQLIFPSTGYAKQFLGISSAAISWAVKQKSVVKGWKASYSKDISLKANEVLVKEGEKEKLCNMAEIEKYKQFNCSTKPTLNKKITLKKDGIEKNFPSLKAAATFLGIKSPTLSMKNLKTIKGWTIVR